MSKSPPPLSLIFVSAQISDSSTHFSSDIFHAKYSSPIPTRSTSFSTINDTVRSFGISKFYGFEIDWKLHFWSRDRKTVSKKWSTFWRALALKRIAGTSRAQRLSLRCRYFVILAESRTPCEDNELLEFSKIYGFKIGRKRHFWSRDFLNLHRVHLVFSDVTWFFGHVTFCRFFR